MLSPRPGTDGSAAQAPLLPLRMDREPLTSNGFPYREAGWTAPADLLHPPFHVDGFTWGAWQRFAWATGETDADHQLGLDQQRWTALGWWLMCIVGGYHAGAALYWQRFGAALAWLAFACCCSSGLPRVVTRFITRQRLALWDDPAILQLSTRAYVHQMGEVQAIVQTQGQGLSTAPIPMRLCHGDASDLQVPSWVTDGPASDDPLAFAYERRIFHEWGVIVQDAQAYATLLARCNELACVGLVGGAAVAWLLCNALELGAFMAGLLYAVSPVVAYALLMQLMLPQLRRTRIDRLPAHSAYKHVERAKLRAGR